MATLSLLHSLILSALQGATEFLPISSSGHLILLRSLLLIEEQPILFDVFLHLPTLAVICLLYRKRIVDIYRARPSFLRPVNSQNIGQEKDQKLLVLLLITTMATGVVGYVIKQLEFSREPHFVALMMLITAAILLSVPLVKRLAKPVENWQPSWWWALLIGITQGLAVLPGISRSGATISIAILIGSDRKTAADFSFLAAIPATIGSLLATLPDISTIGSIVSIEIALICFVVCFFVGLISLIFLLRVLHHGRLHLFSLYLIPLGIIGLLQFSQS